MVIRLLPILLMCLPGLAATYPRISVTVTTTNAAMANAAQTLVSNKVTRSGFMSRVEQLDGSRRTNQTGQIELNWSFTYLSTNTPWQLWRFVSTNNFNSQLSVRAHYHLCPCDPQDPVAQWGPCTDYSISGFVSTNK